MIMRRLKQENPIKNDFALDDLALLDLMVLAILGILYMTTVNYKNI